MKEANNHLRPSHDDSGLDKNTCPGEHAKCAPNPNNPKESAHQSQGCQAAVPAGRVGHLQLLDVG